MEELHKLVRENAGQEATHKYENLAKGLAKVFGTYYAGVEGHEGEISLVAKGLAVSLVRNGILPRVWGQVFMRAKHEEKKKYTQGQRAGGGGSSTAGEGAGPLSGSPTASLRSVDVTISVPDTASQVTKATQGVSIGNSVAGKDSAEDDRQQQAPTEMLEGPGKESVASSSAFSAGSSNK